MPVTLERGRRHLGNIAGLEETLERVRTTPSTSADIEAFLNELLGTSWSSQAQAGYRLQWLPGVPRTVETSGSASTRYGGSLGLRSLPSTRHYIGSVNRVDDLVEGRGAFETQDDFYAFWRSAPRGWPVNPGVAAARKRAALLAKKAAAPTTKRRREP